MPDTLLNCDIGCRNESHLCIINGYYEAIVATLQQVSNSVIPRVPCHSLKPFLNEELDQLKSDSVFGTICGSTQGDHP